MWPFKRTSPTQKSLSTDELRVQLFKALSSPEKLKELCEQYKEQIVENVGDFCVVPAEIRKDPAAVNAFVQQTGAIAQFMSSECDSPELLNRLVGSPEDNPVVEMTGWLEDCYQRADQLEYESLIDEARQFLDQGANLQGNLLIYMQGRLGEFLFQSGKAQEAIAPFETALKLSQDAGDIEGELAYLAYLFEVHRYLGDIDVAVALGDELVALQGKQNLPTREKAVQQLRAGEPLCRVIWSIEDETYELNEVPQPEDGQRMQFQFMRNRMSLRKTERLVELGGALASEGKLAEGLEKFQEAADVDPFDPDPRYQQGICLLDLGAYSSAKEAFAETNRLAPGWFFTNRYVWLSEQLESGSVSDDEFKALRLIQDGGMELEQAIGLAEQAVEKSPGFAPFWLLLGNYQRNSGLSEEAAKSYREGLKVVEEAELECALRCGLATALPECDEQVALFRQVCELNGCLVSTAVATLMMARD